MSTIRVMGAELDHVAYLCPHRGGVECCAEHGAWATSVCCEQPELHEPVALQTRCVHCRRKQWPGALTLVSYGEAGCTWCGKKSEPMTSRQYRQAMLQAQD